MLPHESAELAAVLLSPDREGFPSSPLCLDRVSDDVLQRVLWGAGLEALHHLVSDHGSR